MVFKRLSIADSEKQAIADYRTYQQLCMAKHGNLLLQQSYGVIRKGEIFVLQNGPDTSDLGIRNLWFAMVYATRFVYVALAAFSTGYLSDQNEERIRNLANRLADKREQLGNRARDRWGTEDPFKGLWKDG